MKKDDAKARRVATNLTEHDFLIVDERRKRYGFSSLSEYLRHSALGDQAMPHVTVPQINYEVADGLRAAHSNLNQTVRLAHLSGIDNDLLSDILERIAKIGKSLLRTRSYLYGEFDKQAIILLAKGKLSREDLEKILSEKQS